MAARLAGTGTTTGAAPTGEDHRSSRGEPGLWDELMPFGDAVTMADDVRLLAEHLPEEDVTLLVRAVTDGQPVRICSTDARGAHVDHTVHGLVLVDEQVVGWSQETRGPVSVLLDDIAAVDVA